MITQGIRSIPNRSRADQSKCFARIEKVLRGNRSNPWCILQNYKRNKIRTTDAYYGYTTGVNGMDIRGILEHSPNIPKGIIFVFSVGTMLLKSIVSDTAYWICNFLHLPKDCTYQCAVKWLTLPLPPVYSASVFFNVAPF